MAQFQILIAGTVFGVQSLFDSTKDYCKQYLTPEAPEHFITVRPEDLVFEQEELDREAREEGMKRRKFTDPFLERTAIQRKAAQYLFRKKILLFHGSGLAMDGEGYLFTAAKCGTGKSTHTRFWREVFGSRVAMVNDDKPFLQIAEDGIIMHGAPWSGKHGLQTNMAVPLKGICILERGSENSIRRITPDDAMAMMLHQIVCPDEACRPHLEALAAELAEKTSLWQMACTKDPMAAQISRNAMAKTDD